MSADQFELEAVSPIDGRYSRATKVLKPYLSEAALFKYRVQVEVEYFIALAEWPLPQLESLKGRDWSDLRKIYKDFKTADAQRIKEIEKTTNHDVKAVEYFIKEQIAGTSIESLGEYIHFGLTSQDINNTSVPLLIKDAVNEVVLPALMEVKEKLVDLSQQWRDVPMLARTHGQPASPTRVGKEFYVFVERLEKQIAQLEQIPFSAKFGGATGNFNAHHVAYPSIDWVEFGNYFVNEVLGLDRSQVTTQIEHYDNLAALFDAFKRIGNILIDLDRDAWTYISMDYFKQKIKEGEVGSSAMPHKVNPIDFENSEGNLGLANALFEFLANKLPVSRLQRDLTDSTVLRNVGVPLGHCLIGYRSLLRGLDKLLINEPVIAGDLENHWEIVAEGIQTVLRREGFPKPYEALKDLTRQNYKIDAQSIANFIDGLAIADTVKTELKALTPANYTGINLVP